MISVETAIRRRKWLFKYPWKIWWFFCMIFLLLLIPLNGREELILSILGLENLINYNYKLLFESPWGIFIIVVIFFLLIINSIIYFSFYTKWKQWAFEHVDDPDMFLREAIKNHFFMTSKELEPLNRH